MARSNCIHSRGLIFTCQTLGIQYADKGLEMIDTKKLRLLETENVLWLKTQP